MVAPNTTTTPERSRISKSAVLAGAALAVPFAAQAGPITVTTYDGTYTSTAGNPVSVGLDLLNDGNTEFTIAASLDSDLITITPGSNASYIGSSTPFATATPLADPSFVTLAQPFITDAGGKIQKTLFGTPKLPWPTDGSFAYLGIQFQDNGTNYLGWIHLSATIFNPVTNGTPAAQFAQTFAAVEPNATFTIDGVTFDAVSTPEPASIGLFALGAAGLAALRARRKRVQ